MSRYLLSLAIVSLLTCFTVPMAARAEEAKVDPPAPKVISAPEKWLDVGKEEVLPLAVRPNGRQVIVVGGSKTLLYDLETKQPLRTWDERFTDANYSRDGRRLLTFRDGQPNGLSTQFTVWDADTLKEVYRLTGQPPAWNEPDYRCAIPHGVLSDDGSCVAIANNLKSFHGKLPKGVLIYATTTGQLLQTLVMTKSPSIDRLTFAPDGGVLLVNYAYGRRYPVLWNAATGARIHEFAHAQIAEMSLDGRWIGVTAKQERPTDSSAEAAQLTIWGVAEGKPIHILRHEHPIKACAFSPDSQRVLVAEDIPYKPGRKLSPLGRLVEWELKSGKKLFKGAESPKSYAYVRYSPDGRRRFAITEWQNGMDEDVDRGLCGFMTDTGAKLPIGEYIFDSYNGSENLFFFPQGDRFVDLARETGKFAVRDVLSGKVLQTLPAQGTGATFVAIARNGEDCSVRNHNCLRSLLIEGAFSCFRPRFQCEPQSLGPDKHGNPDNGVSLRPVEELKSSLSKDFSLRTIGRCLRGTVFSAAVSRDESRIVAALSEDRRDPTAPRLVLLDVASPNKRLEIKCYVSALAFHSDGKRFLAATPEGLEQRDAETGERLRTLHKLPGRALGTVYSPDGNLVLIHGVAGHDDPREPVGFEDKGWAMLWDTISEKAASLDGHTGAVTTAMFSPDGKRCATGALDKTIRLWDTATGRLLCILRGHAGGIRQIDYSPRGDRILSAGEDGAAVWNIADFALDAAK